MATGAVRSPGVDVRRARERFHTRIGWLDSYHSFSFSNHFDPANTHHGLLLVSNDDTVRAGTGFRTHPHQDMEIVTYVLEGALQHRDSLGNGEVLRPGEFQRMTAGSGIRHSEFNPSATEPVHLYQIWLMPEARGLTPEYEQKPFPAEGRRGKWQQVASKDGADGSLRIHQDARLFLATLTRLPKPDEKQRVVAYLKADPKADPLVEEVIWVLLNTSEFRFNH